MTKICSQCNIEKDLLEFHKMKNSKDGFRPNCKLCRKTDQNEILKRKEYGNYYRKKFPNKRKEIYWNNREKEILYWKNYYKLNSEKEKNRKKKYNKTEKGKLVKRIASLKRRSLIKSSSDGTVNSQLILELKKQQNNRCFYYNNCNKTLEVYNIEHQIPISRGGKNSKNNIVLTCPLL